MEHSVDTLTAPDSRVETPEASLVEQKIANLYNVISSDHDYLIGPEAKRTEFKDVLSKVHDDIDNTFTLDIEASKVHQGVDLMVAKCFDVAVREKFELIKTKEKEVEITKETNALIGIVFNPPVGLTASKPQIDKWHNEALNVQKEVRSKPTSNQQPAERIIADSYSRVAAAYGAGIPAAKNGKQVIESGDDYKLEWVESQRKKARGKDPDSKATFDAINRISVVAYSTELNDPNALIDKVKSVTRKAVAGVALAGVMSTMSSVIANADTGAKTTEVVPDSTKKADKQISLDEKVSIKANQSPQETKKETETSNADKQDIKNDTLIPPKPDKKPDTKNLEHAIIIPDELVAEPVKTPAVTPGNEKNHTTNKEEAKSELDDSKKSDQDKPTEAPKNEQPSANPASEKEKDANDHAILIDPSNLSGEDDKDNSDDKTHDNDDVTVEPIIDKAPKDTIKDQVIEEAPSIIHGVINIDKDMLDTDSESKDDNDHKDDREDDHEKAPKDDKNDIPRVVDGVLTLDPEELGDDKATDEEVLISPSFEIPKPQIIEIPTYKQETPRQEQAPAAPQNELTHAADKLVGRGGEWTNRGTLMKIFIETGGMTPMHAAAFVGNFMVEAPGLDPATHQGWGGPGRGLGQWGNAKNPAQDRFGYDGKRGLVKFAAERGKPWQDLETQALYVLHELNTTEKDAFQKIMATKTREAATMAVSEFYERPGEPHNPRRVENANIVAAGYNEELNAIRVAAQPPAAPEATPIGQTEREGMVGDIPYAYQLDPRWANMQMPGGGSIGPVACNPTSLSMVAMAIGDKTATPDKVYARYIADGRIGSGGAHQQSILDLAPAFGLRANLIPNNDIEVFKKVINDGGKIILSGNTNGKLLPNPGHFVVVYGISASGNMLVADPGSPGNNGKEFSLQAQNDASNAIRAQFGTTNAGLHYKAVALYAK